MGGHIRPEGWHNWNKEAAEKTAWFAEYASEGPGGSAAYRVKWSRQLTAAEADEFRPGVFLRGSDGWNPVEGR
jgi:pectinesterase